MALKLYVFRLSQPSRAILIFCKVNNIKFAEISVDLLKREHHKPEFIAINPMAQVPAIDDGKLTLFESHAILRYLACASEGVADHWYPADLVKRAKINSVLDWHHSNLRSGSATLLRVTVLASSFGLAQNPEEAVKAEKLLISSLSTIESFWLRDNEKFLVGNSQPSIADISLVCEVMQLELLDEKDCKRILGPFKKVLQWVDNTRRATGPHFEEVHELLFGVKAQFYNNPNPGSTIKALLSSGQ